VRKQHLPWMACAVIAAIATPALASGSAESSPNALVTIGDNYFKDSDGDSQVEISAGQTVFFVSPIVPENQTYHNVAMRSGNPVCNQTKQAPGHPFPIDDDGVAPMPAILAPPGWEGYCRFETPGTYAFICQAHTGMEGTVVVSGATATPTATPTPTPTPQEPSAPTPTPTPEPPVVINPAPAATATPVAKPKLSSASFKRSKRTVTIAGTLAASGKVRVELSYRAGARTRKKTLSLTVSNGKFTGTVKLSAADARKAQKLTVTVTYAGAKANGKVKVTR
jgi:plastocyanin